HRYRALIPGTPVLFHPGNEVLLLKMKAGADVPIGVQRLRGTLMFERVGPNKVRSTESVAVELVAVIDQHDATVSERDWPFGSQAGRYLKDVAMAPLMPFQFLLFVTLCSTSACNE